MESLLVKTLNSQDSSTELQFMENVYSDVVDIEILTTKMEIFKVLLKDGNFFVFRRQLKLKSCLPQNGK